LPDPPDSKQPGAPIIELQSVDSTNNYARLLIEQGGLREISVVFAHEQTAGKGQRGKTWTSEKDANILMSLVIKPALNLPDQFKLLACVAVSVHEFFTKHSNGNTSIKWPNDLYWKDRKAGGILIESMIGRNENDIPEWNWAIIGIGININQSHFPETIANAVSLKQITGRNFNPLELALELYLIFEKKYQQLLTEGFDKIYAHYLSQLYRRNETVKLRRDNQVFEALIKGVSMNGSLIVQTGIEEEYSFGTVEWV
jgi:BirA family transcriptional regulator, biotin operon repressor / biotin---[acetyl-CoA-carboxylase] ligase